MHGVIATLTEYPILTLFVVIGLGYLAGELNLFGFRFGVVGVLFAGLAVGSLSPGIALPEVVPSLGLIIFVYTVGIQSGPVFFTSFRKQGYRDGLLAVGMLVLAAGLAFALAAPLGLSGSRTAGLFCGALTNTPALAAARETVRDHARTRGLTEDQMRDLVSQSVVAYSLAYPIGVIGVLLSFQVLRRLWRVEMKPAAGAPEIHVRDFLIKNPGVAGHTVSEVLRLHKEPGFVISRIQHEGITAIASSATVLAFGDIVAVVGDDEALERAQQIFGERTLAQIELDRSELDFLRFFVSSKEVVGKRIRDLDLQDRLSATITRVRRADVDVVPTPETRLEFGDFVRVLTRKTNFAAVAHLFGNSIRGTAETDFGSVAIGMVLGVVVGLMPVPLPGGTVVRLGLAGGPLLVALVLGNMERTGRVKWAIPASANITLRQIGLLLFLAGVGTRAGTGFLETLQQNGLQVVAAGAAITFTVTLATMFVGYKIFKIPFELLMGIMSGVQTQPACLAFASDFSKSEAPNTGYAGVYPFAMIAKIVLAQLLVTLAGAPQ